MARITASAGGLTRAVMRRASVPVSRRSLDAELILRDLSAAIAVIRAAL